MSVDARSFLLCILILKHECPQLADRWCSAAAEYSPTRKKHNDSTTCWHEHRKATRTLQQLALLENLSVPVQLKNVSALPTIGAVLGMERCPFWKHFAWPSNNALAFLSSKDDVLGIKNGAFAGNVLCLQKALFLLSRMEPFLGVALDLQKVLFSVQKALFLVSRIEPFGGPSKGAVFNAKGAVLGIKNKAFCGRASLAS